METLRQFDWKSQGVLLTAACTAGTLAGLTLYRWTRDYLQLPPGPIGLPIIGRLLSVDKDNLHISCHEIALKYGPISSLYVGTNLLVLVSDPDVARDMFSMPEFSVRQQNPIIDKITQRCGIVFTDGEAWSVQRRLSLQILRNFGFAKSHSEDLIRQSTEFLCMEIFELCSVEEGVNVIDYLTEATNKVIAAITFGQSAEEPDEDFERVSYIFREFLSRGAILNPDFLFPFINRNFSGFLEKLPVIQKLMEQTVALHEYALKQIKKRKMLNLSEPLCLCDSYILEQKKAESQGDFETFKDFQLMRICLELFFAGTDTTSRSLEWLLIYMAAHPPVQEKVFKEIHEVLGDAGVPSMSDKGKLNFCMAVIDETYRISSIGPFGLFHSTKETVYYKGFRIPAHATIAPFLYSIHHNPQLWETPEVYRPERFLDNKGHYCPSSNLMPFSVGKRACLGESLARMEIFLIFVTVMQKFKVSLHPDFENRKAELLRGKLGLVVTCPDYRLLFSER